MTRTFEADLLPLDGDAGEVLGPVVRGDVDVQVHQHLGVYPTRARQRHAEKERERERETREKQTPWAKEGEW